MSENILDKIQILIDSIKNINSLSELEVVRIEISGKKGLLNEAFSQMGNVRNEDKKQFAQSINNLKKEFENIYKDKKTQLDSKKMQDDMQKERLDSSLFTRSGLFSRGHPVYAMRDMIIEYFTSLNFSLEDGPFIEDDFHNFEALNLPKFHPARDMQDTFYFKDSMLLRTHTSPVQIRTMKGTTPPLRMICTGATFRRDYDITHSPMFHQCEGLVVDSENKISFAHLKSLLEDFLRYIFGDVKIRFRSSFFPFTEPSAEVDIGCVFCIGDGCKVCSNTGWLEVLGCGMVDDNVFSAVGYKNVSGYAFGLGIERLAMLKWGFNDLRSFYELDLRLMEQF